MIPYYHDAVAGITIYHGDSTAILPQITDDIDTLISDVPYGDNHDTDYTRFTGGRLNSDGTEVRRLQYKVIASDARPFNPLPLLKIGRQQILFGANRYSDKLPCGSLLIWDKRTQTGSKGVMSDAEVAWWSRGRGVYIFAHTWDGFNRASERNTNYHPTQKPVALFRWCIQKAGVKGLIVDPYMGSGPILQAAKELGIPAIGIEIEEEYCERAAMRLSQNILQLF